MKPLIALLAGSIFGVGLAVSDMIDPARVLGFLDITSGAWDPTLAFVMGGAMIPMLIAWRMRPSAPGTTIDAKLIGGAAMFGVGWGLVGLCPGPALSALTLGGWPVWLFVAAMLAGMALAPILTRGRANAHLQNQPGS